MPNIDWSNIDTNNLSTINVNDFRTAGAVRLFARIYSRAYLVVPFPCMLCNDQRIACRSRRAPM